MIDTPVIEENAAAPPRIPPQPRMPNLRECAEARIRELEARTEAAGPPEDARQLLHELRVHQVELELQNEELRRVQEALEISRARYFDLYDLAPVGYVTLDRNGLIQEANLASASLCETPRARLIGQPLTRFILPEDQDVHYRARLELQSSGESQVYEVRLRRERLPLLWIRVQTSIAPAPDSGDPLWRVVLVDISARKELEERSVRLAQQDPLTGLPGRGLLVQLAEHMLAAARRAGTQLAVLFFDLDLFKLINDTHGHTVGDQLLQAVGARLRGAFRAEDLVARLGGDEFVAVLGNLHRPDDALQAARAALDALTPPYSVAGRELHCVPSVGISLFPLDGETVGHLIHRADQAMYQAKRTRSGCYPFSIWPSERPRAAAAYPVDEADATVSAQSRMASQDEADTARRSGQPQPRSLMKLDSDRYQGVAHRSECLATPAEVDAALDRMAAAITERLADQDPLVLCLMTGGIIVTGRLLPRLDFQLRLDYLHATRYQGATSGGELAWRYRPSDRIRGEHILLLDDILDEGITLDQAVRACREDGAASILTAVLVEKRRPHACEADIVGLQTPDRYLYGCGLDYRNYFRNAPGIHAVAAADI